MDLLLASKAEDGAKGGEQIHVPLTSPPTSDLTEMQDLLLRGERESAVSEALTQKNYALALLIASMCDRTTYRITAQRFADETLHIGSPLHTATLLFSDNLEIPDDAELLDPYGKQARRKSFWYDDEIYGTLVESWREQLSSIMCNQTAGWERIVVSLGDRLLQLGQCHAAHVCYLVSFSSFGPPSEDTTRLALLGCDHRVPMNQMLMTPQSIRSFELTEAFEWARRRGNRKTHIPSLQPFKVRYAELLADFGYEELAREYLLSVHSCIGLDSDRANNCSSNAATRDLNFVQSLKLLEDRLCGPSGSKQSLSEGKDKSKGGVTSLAPERFMKSALGKKPKAVNLPTDKKKYNDDAIFPHKDDDPTEVLSPVNPDPNLPHQLMELHSKPQATDGAAVASASLARDEDYTATEVADTPSSSRLQSSALGYNTPASIRGPVAGDGKDASVNDQQGPPSSAPPMFWGETVRSDGEVAPTLSKEEEKKMEIVPSTPIHAEKKGEPKKAPVSEPPSE